MTTPYDEESLPLLARPGRRRENSVATFFARGRSNTINSLRSGFETVKKHKNEFWLFLIGSLVLYLGFTLAFLPRTSLSRDFRRAHFSKLTKSEAFRIYVETLMGDNRCPEYLQNYTSTRHWTGDESALDYTVEQLANLGFSPSLHKYYTWLNEPVSTEVTLWDAGRQIHNASMIEDDLGEQFVSSRHGKKVFAFHGYSANGTATSEFVYCNYGEISDYQVLNSHGIDLKGKVHIIRYGDIDLGIVIKNAELHGALGAILYTDSADDGTITERNGYKPFPHGPARHESSIQRGSALLYSTFPGDPSTPGYPSKHRDDHRINSSDMLPSIPSVPLSEREVAPILRQLNGKGMKWTHEGNVKGFQYYSGPSAPGVECRIVNEQKYLVKEIVNVMVEIPGLLGQQEVVIGNHRDSWTPDGAGHPNSGSAVLLEIARGFSELHKRGWKPLRTIKLISWDGGEQGMLGSTEYCEEHAESLTRGTVAYFNLDSGITGSLLKIKANPLLNELLVHSSKKTLFKEDPDLTLYEYWRQANNNTFEILGGGSDYVAFQDQLGIPSVDFSFARDPSRDAVHQLNSNYDSYEWMQKYVDPDFSLHSTLAMYIGISTLSLTENELLGFKTHEYMAEITRYYKSFERAISSAFPRDKEISTLKDNLIDLLELITTHTSVNFDEMVDFLREQTQQDYPWWQWNKKLLLLTRLISTNSKLRKLDRYFLTDRGLLDRAFMRHSVFAPNKLNGQRGDVLPGLHEALLSGNRHECLYWLQTLLTQLDQIVSLLTV